MKKAFTLIEVLISVFIVFLVVSTVYNFFSNTRFLIQKIEEVKKFNEISSIMFIEKKGKNLYESLIDFNITNDKIIKDLKNYKLNIETIPQFENEFNNTNFFVNKLKVYDKNYSTYIYEIGIKEKNETINNR